MLNRLSVITKITMISMVSMVSMVRMIRTATMIGMVNSISMISMMRRIRMISVISVTSVIFVIRVIRVITVRRRGSTPVPLALLLILGNADVPTPARAGAIQEDPPAIISSATEANPPDENRSEIAARSDSLYSLENLKIENTDAISSREVERILLPDRERTLLSKEEIRTALGRLGSKLLELGYLESELDLFLRSNGDKVEPTLEIRAGPPAAWDSLQVRVLQSPEARRTPRPTGNLDAERFERLLQEWVEEWADRGYPFAVARVESLVVREGRVRAGVLCDPGPLLLVDQLDFPGRKSTRTDFLLRWVRFRPGALYRESEWRARRRRVEQSGLFIRVGDPVLERLPSGGLSVSLPVEEGHHNRLEGAVGYASRGGSLTGFAAVELGNLFGTGRKLGLRWERFLRDQSRFRLDAWEPLLPHLPLGARLSLEQEVRDSTYTIFRSELLLEAAVGWDLFVSAGGEIHRSTIGPEPAEQVRRISSVVGGRWETLRPGRWEGGRVRLSLRSGRSHIRPPDGGPSQRLRIDRGEVDAERFVRPGWGLLLRGRLVAAGIAGSSRLPPSEALRIGGAPTIRGYAEETFAVRRFVAGQVELGVALPASGARAYLFLDGGTFRELGGSDRDRTVLGYGVGLASETAARGVTLDLGIPEGGGLREGRLHLRLQSRF